MVALVEDLSKIQRTDLDFITMCIGRRWVGVLGPKAGPMRSPVIHMKCRSYSVKPNVTNFLALTSAQIEKEFSIDII